MCDSETVWNQSICHLEHPFPGSHKRRFPHKQVGRVRPNFGFRSECLANRASSHVFVITCRRACLVPSRQLITTSSTGSRARASHGPRKCRRKNSWALCHVEAAGIAYCIRSTGSASRRHSLGLAQPCSPDSGSVERNRGRSVAEG